MRCIANANLKTESAGAHLALGYVASREGDLGERPQTSSMHAIAIFEETSNEPDLIRALNELARVERLEGATGSARELLERSISLTGSSDAPILAWAHRELGITFADDDARSRRSTSERRSISSNVPSSRSRSRSPIGRSATCCTAAGRSSGERRLPHGHHVAGAGRLTGNGCFSVNANGVGPSARSAAKRSRASSIVGSVPASIHQSATNASRIRSNHS